MLSKGVLSAFLGLAAFTFYAQSWNETRKSIKAINCYCCCVVKYLNS